ncbi:hypothetical protein I4F81_010630 [Pyropia yezoensis]|uniref:Uncharacterized protein n=1 Tax=Pyropia yezoensis TaxID=2788 RepID=A0ACC3CDH8_PYRYE|nr:hypothetical protein I4F81_010630 [Neopyropia yezoensis]
MSGAGVSAASVAAALRFHPDLAETSAELVPVSRLLPAAARGKAKGHMARDTLSPSVPTAKLASVGDMAVAVMACKPLRHVLSVYFHKLNMNKEGLRPALATKWKNDNNYTDSELGTSAIGAAMNTLYRRAGINDMFVPASAVGSKAHVVGCMRVCSLVSLCVRSFMDEVESASEEGVPTFADKSLSRSSWAAELELTASFWPKSDAVHHEVRLIDGGDDGRAVLAFPVGDNPVSRLDGDMGAADDDAFDDMDGFESDT